MLAMDSPPPTFETPPAAATPNRRCVVRRFLAVSVSLLVILVVLVLVFASPNPQFVWLTPAQMTQASHPGPLTQLKYKLIRLAGPLMRFYHSHRPNISISSNILATSSPAAPASLGAPFITNAGGMNAWILSPAELASFRQALKTNSGVTMLSSPSMQTPSGVATRALVGQFIPLSPGVSANIGITMDATATAYSGSVKMLLGVNSTELSGASTTNGLTIKTNFSTACRVLLPDAGALVINCRNADATNPTNYWLIVTPVLVDATGKPIKK
jgi:hypothetical protein